MSQEQLQKQCIGFLQTPALWENKQFGIQQFAFPEIDLNHFTPTKIPRNIRLGHQMEHVFKQLLEYSDAYEILVYNLPIRQDKITLGEIDFILKKRETIQLLHVELTYKFYIIDTDISEPIHQLIGPNKHDAFFAKMEKIKNNQFPLIHSEEGVKSLNNNNVDVNNIEHQCCFKAQLFQPYGNMTLHLEPLNANCIVGYWLRMDAFHTSPFTNHTFYIPTKFEWAMNPHSKVPWKSHAEISMDISQSLDKMKSPMVWMRKSETAFEKFFVVWWK